MWPTPSTTYSPRSARRWRSTGQDTLPGSMTTRHKPYGGCALIIHTTLRERGAGAYPPPPYRSLPFAFAAIFQGRTRRVVLNGTTLERLFPNTESPGTGLCPWGGRKSHLADSSQGHQNSGSALIQGDNTGSGGRILRKSYRDFAVESSMISAGYPLKDADKHP